MYAFVCCNLNQMAINSTHTTTRHRSVLEPRRDYLQGRSTFAFTGRDTAKPAPTDSQARGAGSRPLSKEGLPTSCATPTWASY